MARTNYQFQKRQKEMERKKKKELKRQQKLEKKRLKDEEQFAEEPDLDGEDVEEDLPPV